MKQQLRGKTTAEVHRFRRISPRLAITRELARADTAATTQRIASPISTQKARRASSSRHFAPKRLGPELACTQGELAVFRYERIQFENFRFGARNYDAERCSKALGNALHPIDVGK